ncbi:MAG TPA: hypothetical protein VFI65_17630 [Streptosporangiaceae bacterium]|nr:hypothetical protein [Streptosporangiaceae bacterium]
MNALTDLLELNGAERRLWHAVENDAVADLRGHGNGTPAMIRAEVLRDMCTGGRQWRVKDRIRMIGGYVRGRLDLSGAYLTHAVEFTDCVFEDTIDLRRARSEKSLKWVGRRFEDAIDPNRSRAGPPTGTGIRPAMMASILADEFDSDANLTVAGVTVTGVISLHWANVRGDLRLTDSHLMPPGGQAVAGRDLRVEGTMFMDGADFHAEGEVCLRSARVRGDLDCSHGRFENPSGRSIDGDHLIVDGELLLQGYHDDAFSPSHYGREEDFHSDGEVSLQWAQIHRLRASGGKFANPSGYALHADALHARDGVYLDRGFEATAEVRLVGATIAGELCCTQGHFDNPSGSALNAERIKADDVYLDRGFRASGQVRFTDAQVSRHFNATGGFFRNDQALGYALDADGLCCHGEVYLNDGFHAVGAVSLTGAEIANQLNCTAGYFDNRDGFALFADGLTTPGMVYLDKGCKAIGQVRFARATIGRQLVCTDGTFDNEHDIALDITGLVCQGDVLLNSTGSESRTFGATGKIVMRNAQIARDLDFTNARLDHDKALDARAIQVGGCLTWNLDPPGHTDLSRATISRLDDTAGSWPPRQYSLTGINLRTVGDQLTLDQRKNWLRRTDIYSPDAYGQLAQVYQQAGRQGDAQEILIASQRDLRDKERGNLPWRSRAWNRFIDHFVGYGYKLHRPFIILLITGLVGGVIFLIAQHANLIDATSLHNVSAFRRSPPHGYPPFYPFAYSYQLLIPGIDLREASDWLPDATKSNWGLFMMVVMWMMIIFGWVLATAVVAGITRLFRQR